MKKKKFNKLAKQLNKIKNDTELASQPLAPLRDVYLKLNEMSKILEALLKEYEPPPKETSAGLGYTPPWAEQALPKKMR